MLPSHIAIIMDGNHRWALQNNVDIEIGYRKGAEAADRIIAHCSKLGIQYLTLYAFSVENWNRPQNEIELIMSLLKEVMLNKIQNMNDIRILFIGDRSKLHLEIVILMTELEKLSQHNNGLCVRIAISYSSRNEILNAAYNAFERQNLNIYTQAFEKQINPHNIPYPDLLIRTSGEKRLSNFLLWEIAYSELYFSEVLWPDFNEEHFNDALLEFKTRVRRFGNRT